MKKWLFALFFCVIQQSLLMSSAKILIKIPTRERCESFFSSLNKYVEYLSGKNEVTFLISCDNDDYSMNNSETIKRLSSYPNLFFYFAERTNKIHAINRDIEKHLDFDILISASDDMIPIEHGYDQIIVDAMLKYFPAFDGVLNFNDGFVGSELNTLPIIGKKYFERFNYIYYPGYQSVACDVELTLVSKMLAKQACLDKVIIKHFHPAYGYSSDSLFIYNESAQLYLHDSNLLYQRKALNFNLKEEDILYDKLPTSLDIFGNADTAQVRWSILICTLNAREKVFSTLYSKLVNQIRTNNLGRQVEIIFFKDDRKYSVGYKRNLLLDSARGEYVCFVDDDDDVSDNYIKLLYQALSKSPDCVSLCGLLFQESSLYCKFYHSIKYKSYFNKDRTYFRPPNHLNVIRSSIAKKFKFPEINFGEDTDWAMQICNSGLLKDEVKIKKPYYYYYYDGNKN